MAQSTLMREAYFVDFAVAMREKVSVPLMVTGGFRQRAGRYKPTESNNNLNPLKLVTHIQTPRI